MKILESLAYGLGRGFARAWLDILAEKDTAELETVTDEDEKRRDNFASAVDAELHPTETHSDP